MRESNRGRRRAGWGAGGMQTAASSASHLDFPTVLGFVYKQRSQWQVHSLYSGSNQVGGSQAGLWGLLPLKAPHRPAWPMGWVFHVITYPSPKPPTDAKAFPSLLSHPLVSCPILPCLHLSSNPTVTANGVTHAGGLSIAPLHLFVSEVCTVLVSVSGCWYLRQQTWPLLTPYCLTLDRKNTHNIPFKTILHTQDSKLQGLFLLKYLWTAGYFGHVEHGINAGPIHAVSPI